MGFLKKRKKSFDLDFSLKIKDINPQERETLNALWRNMVISLDANLKSLYTNGKISISTLNEFNKVFNIEEVFKTPTQPISPTAPPQTPIAPAPTPQPVSTPTKPTPSPQSLPLSTPRPTPTETPTPASPTPSPSFSIPKIPSRTRPTQPPTSPPMTPSPSTAPAPAPQTPSVGVGSRPTAEKITKPLQISVPRLSTASKPASTPAGDEEDRATGIAILRQQMLSELKKIRSEVSKAPKR